MGFLEKFFMDFLNMGITAGYVIIAVFLVRVLLRRTSKRFSYYLWATVGFRLLCPISFTSALSIFNFSFFRVNSNGNTGIISYIPAGVAAMSEPKISVGIPSADQFINQSIPAASASGINPLQIIITVSIVIWIAGAGILLLYGIAAYIRIRLRVSKAIRKEDNIYECAGISSPFVLGILKPRIYIPFRLSGDEIDYIISHERYHIKRKDYIIKPLSFILLSIYWFNPLVWLAFRGMSRDMEMSCDEKVIQDMGVSIKKTYSLSLLSFAVNYRFPAAGPLAFGETNMKGRIKNILKFKKTDRRISAVVAILCIIAAAAFAANPIQKKSEKGFIPASEADDNNVSDMALKLFENRNQYIGDAPADGRLIQISGVKELGNYTLELETIKQPYILRVVFSDEITDPDSIDIIMMDYATELLALIDNADEIQWSYPYRSTDGTIYRIIVYWNNDNLRAMGINDIKSYGESAAKVQELIDILYDYHQSNSVTENGIPLYNAIMGLETSPVDELVNEASK